MKHFQRIMGRLRINIMIRTTYPRIMNEGSNQEHKAIKGLAIARDERENKVPTIYETGFDSAQPLMAERSRSHTLKIFGQAKEKASYCEAFSLNSGENLDILFPFACWASTTDIAPDLSCCGSTISNCDRYLIQAFLQITKRKNAIMTSLCHIVRN